MTRTTTTVPLSLKIPFYDALSAAAEAKQMGITDFIQRIVEDYVLAKGLLSEKDASDASIMHWLTDEVRKKAQNICKQGRFSRSITLDTLHACLEDPKWTDAYATYVGGPIHASGNPRKANLNQNLGYWIKRAIGGENELGSNGKTANEKVQNEIIQSYTPFSDFDRNGVWMK